METSELEWVNMAIRLVLGPSVYTSRIMLGFVISSASKLRQSRLEGG